MKNIIRQLRRRSGQTQGRFARRLGVSQQTISDWERGRNLGAVETALRLLRLMGRTR